MPLKVQRFEVFMWPEGTTPEAMDATEPEGHTIRVLYVDQLMGERAAIKSGLGIEAPMNLTTAWAYAAMQRLGHYPKDRPLALFMATDCAGIQKPAEPEPEDGEAVDPTPSTPPNMSG